jgi:hypothetical protein
MAPCCSSVRKSLAQLDQERGDIERLLGCFSKPVWTAVQELKKERDDKSNRIQDLKDMKSSLEREPGGAARQHPLEERGKASSSGFGCHPEGATPAARHEPAAADENVELTKQLKNVKTALILEEGIQKNLAIAAEGAKLIMASDKVELIQKDLEHLYKGEPQALKTLYNAMQMFTNGIIQVKEGLEKELKATRQYLQAKH